MGCICSKICSLGNDREDIEKEKDLSKTFATPPDLPGKEEVLVKVAVGRIDGSVGKGCKPVVHVDGVSASLPSGDIANSETKVVQATGSIHEKQVIDDPGLKLGPLHVSRVASLPNGAVGEQVVAGWPSWLSSVAGEAIKGWVPRRAESFEKLDKIGQGTYSSVYRARDLETGKLVAMKKVRFVNMDPESVRFMAREIYILRRLDHPNVMKLEGLVTSRISGSLYLIFEYMEHDLSGLAAAHGTKFTECQIKCYIQQLLLGLEHCHNRGVLHRDIKGSNLLLDNNGNLKIGDFGLATQFEPDQSQPLTSRVVTLWYRAPELLLGSTEYGVGVDLWSTGCILAELFSGKPIMPGRTEVEQMHKIFKLCGSPSEEYWRKLKLPHATSFKPHHSYKRILREAFKEFPSSALSLVEKLLSIEPDRRGTAASSLQSEFFTSKPLPCDPSNLPKYPPSKEFDAKLQNEARRKRAETVRGRGPESVRRGSRDVQNISTPESDSQKQGHFNINMNTQWRAAPADQPKGALRSGLSHCTSMVHPTADTLWAKKAKDGGPTAPMRVSHAELRSQKSKVPQGVPESSRSSQKNDELISAKEFSKGHVPKNRIHYSGPLMPPGGNIDEMLREHEKQIQLAVRKARLNKNKAKEHYENDPQLDFLFPRRNVL